MKHYHSRPLDNNAIPGITAISAISKELPKPMRFPVDAMPEPCQPLINEAAEAIGCPPEFIAVPMLVILGTAIGNSRVLRLKAGWEEGAALYAAIIAQPGEKKSPATKVAVEPAIKAQADFRKEHADAMADHSEKLREHEVEKRDAHKNGRAAPALPEEPVMERTLVEDITVEALAVRLDENPRGLAVVRDELSAWVRGMDQYRAGGKGSDRQFWLSAWSGNYAAVDRKSSREPLILPKPFVGVFGGIQPSILPEVGEGREDGLVDRFLLSYPEPVYSEWSDTEISVVAREGYRGLYDKLRTLDMPTDQNGDPSPGVVAFSPDAKDLLKRAIGELRREMYSPGFPARLKGPWSKLEAYIARLALILALCRAVDKGVAERVEEEDILAAVVLVDYFRTMARRVAAGLYGENPDERLMEDVAKFLAARGGRWDGQPTALHNQLTSDYKPPTPEALTRKLRTLAEKHPEFGFDSQERWVKEVKNKRRFVTLTLENRGNGGNSGNETRTVPDKKVLEI